MYSFYRIGRKDILIDMWNEGEIEKPKYSIVVYPNKVRIFDRAAIKLPYFFPIRNLFPEGLPRENRMMTCMELAMLEDVLINLGYIARKEQKGESDEIMVDKPSG